MKKAVILVSLCFYISTACGQWHNFTYYNFSAAGIYGMGSPYGEYGCFCSPDSGSYEFGRFQSNTSGTGDWVFCTTNAGASWTCTSSDLYGYGQQPWTVSGCFLDKRHHILYRFEHQWQWGTPNYNHILGYSMDCGHHWASFANYNFMNTSGPLFSSADNNNCYMYGNNMLVRLKRGIGHTQVHDTFSFRPQLMYFTDTLNGYMVASKLTPSPCCCVLKTTNGGIQFDTVYLDTAKNFTCIYFIDSLTGYIGGLHGNIIKTTDGGISWQEVNAGIDKKIYRMDFCSESTGVIAGDAGFIMITFNGGQSWNLENTGISGLINAIYNFNDSVFYAQAGVEVYAKDLLSDDSADSINEKFKLYPNPATEKINIEITAFRDYENISLFNVQGKLLLQRPIEQVITELNISSLDKGVYIVRVLGADINMIKILKQ